MYQHGEIFVLKAFLNIWKDGLGDEEVSALKPNDVCIIVGSECYEGSTIVRYFILTSLGIRLTSSYWLHHAKV